MKTSDFIKQILWGELKQFLVTYITRNETEIKKLHICYGSFRNIISIHKFKFILSYELHTHGLISKQSKRSGHGPLLLYRLVMVS